MAVDADNLLIVHYPDPVLRAKTTVIKSVTAEVRRVVDRMTAIMREEEGIGLAAPQVGLAWKLFICDVPESDERSASDDPPTASPGLQVYINPKLTKPTGPLEPFEEGCLSLPEIRGRVLRPPMVTITAMGLDGETFTQTGAGLLARCWQHEMDHLDGILIIDRMLQEDRLKNRTKVKALEK